MTTYKYLKLGLLYGIRVRSTDTQSVEFIKGEVKKLIPSCQVYEDPLFLQIKNLQAKEIEILWRIMGLLGEQGWEPFAIQAGGEHDECVYYHFRQELTER